MTMESPRDLTRAELIELHGLQLRLATDSLEDGAEMFELRLELASQDANQLLADVGRICIDGRPS